MGITDFLSSVALNFRNKYLEMATVGLPEPTPVIEDPIEQTAPASSSGPVDTYEPSGETVSAATDIETNQPVDEGTGDETKTKPVELDSDDVVYQRRSSSLDMQLNLQFDLAAVTSTVARLANGDQEAFEELVIAGFGFHADFAASGTQVVEEGYQQDASGLATHQKSRNILHARGHGQFAYQSRNFALQSFYNESASIKSMLDVKEQDGYRRAVNRFALRFRMDNQFSMAFANRFNVQTEQIATDQPDAVGSYVNAAGEVAMSGTNEMMTAFFDSVDSYLGETEDKLIESVSAFFDMAAEQLGFSEETVSMAEESLVGSITDFFDRVETSMGMLQAQFAPPAPEITEPADPGEVAGVEGQVEPAPFAPVIPESNNETTLLAVA